MNMRPGGELPENADADEDHDGPQGFAQERLAAEERPHEPQQSSEECKQRPPNKDNMRFLSDASLNGAYRTDHFSVHQIIRT